MTATASIVPTATQNIAKEDFTARVTALAAKVKAASKPAQGTRATFPRYLKKTGSITDLLKTAITAFGNVNVGAAFHALATAENQFDKDLLSHAQQVAREMNDGLAQMRKDKIPAEEIEKTRIKITRFRSYVFGTNVSIDEAAQLAWDASDSFDAGYTKLAEINQQKELARVARLREEHAPVVAELTTLVDSLVT